MYLAHKPENENDTLKKKKKPENEAERRSPEKVAQSKRLPSPPATMAAAGEASTTVLRFFSFIGAGGAPLLSP